MTEKMDEIDLTPTWEQALGVYIACMENGIPEGVITAKKELKRMAQLADLSNEARQLLKDCVNAFNEIPNKRLNNGISTYDLASRAGNILSKKI